MEIELGIDLGDLHSIVNQDYRDTSILVDARLNFFFNALDQLDNGFSVFNGHVIKTESTMWIVPGLLFSISVLSAGAMFGSLLAWKKKSGERMQMAMSYLLLPALIIVALGCWAVVSLTSVGTMLTSGMSINGARDWLRSSSSHPFPHSCVMNRYLCARLSSFDPRDNCI